VGLAALGGGCQVPIGVHCRRIPHLPIENAGRYGAPGGFEILGVVADPDGGRVMRSFAVGDEAVELGRAVAADLLEQGASELFAGIGIH
jgi:hydroxymethylbilane synthase